MPLKSQIAQIWILHSCRYLSSLIKLSYRMHDFHLSPKCSLTFKATSVLRGLFKLFLPHSCSLSQALWILQVKLYRSLRPRPNDCLRKAVWPSQKSRSADDGSLVAETASRRFSPWHLRQDAPVLPDTTKPPGPCSTQPVSLTVEPWALLHSSRHLSRAIHLDPWSSTLWPVLDFPSGSYFPAFRISFPILYI